jgi:hypothetical protein
VGKFGEIRRTRETRKTRENSGVYIKGKSLTGNFFPFSSQVTRKLAKLTA